jgi:hypothetical protein
MRLNALPAAAIVCCCPIIFVSFGRMGFCFTPRLWQVWAGASSR